MTEDLESAVIAALHERPDSARGLAARLSRSGAAPVSASSVNSVLYRLEREERTRRVPASPPVWRLLREQGDPVPVPVPVPKVTRASSNRPVEVRPPVAPVAAGNPMSSMPDIWQVAVRHLAKGRRLHLNSLAALIRHDTGLSEGTIASVLRDGSDTVEVVGPYLDLRPEHRLTATLEALLPDLITTPEGRPRPSAVGLEAVGGSRKIVARFEVVDDDLPYWCCVRIRTNGGWSALRIGAETVGSDWRLPWRVPPNQPTAFPGILVWRVAEVNGLVSVAKQVADSLSMHTFTSVQLTPIPRPMAPIQQFDLEQQTIARLVRRRGPIGRGRKHPVQGTCDHCGQPLSDPYSLLVGVGPVCRGYYSQRVLSAVARAREIPETPKLTAAGRGPSEALSNLAADWRWPSTR